MIPTEAQGSVNDCGEELKADPQKKSGGDKMMFPQDMEDESKITSQALEDASDFDRTTKGQARHKAGDSVELEEMSSSGAKSAESTSKGMW